MHVYIATIMFLLLWSCGWTNRPRKAQVTMARPPPPAPPEVDPDDIPEYSIGEQDERGESVHLLQNEPARSLQEHDFDSPDNESSPFNDGAGLKSICGVPGARSAWR